jgi:hypothetical protein
MVASFSKHKSPRKFLRGLLYYDINFVMQHPLFSNVVASQIASLKLSLVDDAVSLQISMEKIR